jgi:CRP-like cAMP-binding protein
MSEGSYFGEIGVLLTHKRTVSVKSCSVSILFTVDRDELLQVLNEFPLHMKYLCAVAKQRMKTTKPEDLVN